MSQAADLRADYERLGVLLQAEDDGAKAAALARERRMIGELLEGLESPGEVTVVDELASRRRPLAEDPGPSAGRRRSRGG